MILSLTQKKHFQEWLYVGGNLRSPEAWSKWLPSCRTQILRTEDFRPNGSKWFVRLRGMLGKILLLRFAEHPSLTHVVNCAAKDVRYAVNANWMQTLHSHHSLSSYSVLLAPIERWFPIAKDSISLLKLEAVDEEGFEPCMLGRSILAFPH